MIRVYADYEGIQTVGPINNKEKTIKDVPINDVFSIEDTYFIKVVFEGNSSNFCLKLPTQKSDSTQCEILQLDPSTEVFHLGPLKDIAYIAR